MKTLYRKYRPGDFSEVFGQKAIVKVIVRQVKEKKVGHAYLFAGPRGTGKTSMARLLAKAVNCKNPKEGNSCRECGFCKDIEKGRFLDLIEIDAASNRGIDEIRRLRERVGFSPSEGVYKVYIIDEVHMLTKDAFNALLKTLEEPPSHIIFILATTEPHKVLPTILSRCQRFNFSLASDEVLIERLKYICKKEEVAFSKEALNAIVRNSGGSFRDGESILEKVLGAVGVKKDGKIDFEDVRGILGLAEEREIRKFVEMLLGKDASGGLKIFNSIADSGINLFQFLRQVLEYTRSLMVKKVSTKSGDASLSDLLKLITEFSDAEGRLKFTSVERLPIEVAIIRVCEQEDLVGNDQENIKGDKKRKIGKVFSEATNVISQIPKKIKTSVKESNDEDDQIEVTLEQVKRKWKFIIGKILPFNHHLFSFFNKAKPIKLHGSVLTLEVPYRFHKNRIESSKAREVFTGLSEKIFGICLTCVCEVSNDKEEITDNYKSSDNEGLVLDVMKDLIE